MNAACVFLLVVSNAAQSIPQSPGFKAVVTRLYFVPVVLSGPFFLTFVGSHLELSMNVFIYPEFLIWIFADGGFSDDIVTSQCIFQYIQ